MQGITMTELYEWITHSHEAEFVYNKTLYMLQPEEDAGKFYLVIWNCSPDTGKCITKHEIPAEGDIPKEVIDAVLEEKCFDGKSFKDAEKDITVTAIY